MSQLVGDNVASASFSEAVIPLLKEYTEKLQRLGHTALELREHFPKADATGTGPVVKAEFELLTKQLNSLSPPASDLARTVSQRIEHGDVEDIARLELRLRLAEFEHALAAARRLLAVARP